jgi:hypothetical protein
MKVDVSELTKTNEGLYTLIQTMLDLSDITGTNISYNNGMLDYAKNEDGSMKINTTDDGKELGSSGARNYLKGLITSDLTVKVSNDNSQGTKGGGAGNVNLNSDQIDNNTYAVSNAGLDSRTFSYGFSFLHESLHTATGTKVVNPNATEAYADAPKSDAGVTTNPGSVEKILNQYRKQLGTSWGQRVDYWWLSECSTCPKSMYWSKGGQTIGVTEAKMPDGQKQKARELILSIGRNIPFLNLPK